MECLVTKLKATVNNPSLPILETMQQFTLDVIANSGNSNMTNAQKWALNHFFYQIGAIDGSGVYNKLQVLILPMICGEDIRGATKNIIVGGSEATEQSSQVTFINHGLVSTTSTYKNAATYTFDAQSATTIFVASAKSGAKASARLLGERSGVSTTSQFDMLEARITLSISPYTRYNSLINGSTTLNFDACACINLSTPEIKAAGGDIIEEELVAHNYMSTEAEGLVYNTFTPMARAESDGGFCASCVGFNLDDDEAYLFLTALNELYNEFVVS